MQGTTHLVCTIHCPAHAAMQATLEAFLTRMVEDEALTGFELSVSATRAQEIAGEVAVVMTLQPTFSIDFIRVIMNLS